MVPICDYQEQRACACPGYGVGAAGDGRRDCDRGGRGRRRRTFAEKADAVLAGEPAPVAELGIDEQGRGRARQRKDEETGEYVLPADRWQPCFYDLSGNQAALGWIGKEKLRRALNLRARVTGSVLCECQVRDPVPRGRPRSSRPSWPA
jgi:hypothetical protein